MTLGEIETGIAYCYTRIDSIQKEITVLEKEKAECELMNSSLANVLPDINDANQNSSDAANSLRNYYNSEEAEKKVQTLNQISNDLSRIAKDVQTYMKVTEKMIIERYERRIALLKQQIESFQRQISAYRIAASNIKSLDDSNS